MTNPKNSSRTPVTRMFARELTNDEVEEVSGGDEIDSIIIVIETITFPTAASLTEAVGKGELIVGGL